MNKNLIVAVVVIVVIIAGIAIANKNVLVSAESLNFLQCKPNWIKSQFIDNLVLRVQDITAEEGCKKSCYESYKVTSIKVENTIHSLTNSTGFYCYCDINDCK